MDSDLVLNYAALHGPTDPVTAASNAQIEKVVQGLPNWWEIGAAEYRRKREADEFGLGGYVYLDSAVDIKVPSRDKGRYIPCRLFKPEKGHDAIDAVFMHIHGGGWVLMSEKAQDPALQDFANRAGITIVSVGYRLAPEHPFPAGPEDCYDVADWLVDNAEAELGGKLKFISGESGGGHLSMLSHLHLIKSRPDFFIHALVLNYGVYNLSELFPSTRHGDAAGVKLTMEDIDAARAAFLPGRTISECSDPSISPFYARLDPARTPPALFVCGEKDSLLDDSVFMSVRWQATGQHGPLRLFAGAPHAFREFPKEVYPDAEKVVQLEVEWCKKWAGVEWWKERKTG